MAQDLIEKIRAAAQAKGVDPEVAVSIARAESGLDPNAKAKSSTASGLFQILNSTWSGNKGTPGKQFDSDENIRVGTDIISQNVNSLKKFLGRDPSPKEVYAAHYFGATGAQKFLTAAPDTPAKQLFSEKVLAANPNLQGKTAAQISAQLESKLKVPASNVPRETMAKKEREPLPESLPPMAKADQPTPAPAKATAMAKMDVKSMPASYQAAFALAALADAQDEEDDRAYNENKQTETEEFFASYKPVNHLASLDLEVKPVMMADGGEVTERKDEPIFDAASRTYVDVLTGRRTPITEKDFTAKEQMAMMDAVRRSQARGGKGRVDYEDYPSGEQIGPGFVDIRNTLGGFQYKQNPDGSTSISDRYDFHGPRAAEYEKMGTGEKVLKSAKNALSAFVKSGGGVRDAAGELGDAWIGSKGPQVNIRIPVKRADGSPEEGERLTPQQIERIAAQEAAEREAASNAAFIAQKSGIGRKEGNISKALRSGEGQVEMAKGMTMMPQNILGAPVDLATMAMRPFGYDVEKPFMGSEYLKEKTRDAGLAFKPSEDPTLAGFFEAGNISSGLVNPAGVTRTGVKAAEKTGEAARMLAKDFQQYNQELAVPGASYIRRPAGGVFPTAKSVEEEPISALDTAIKGYIGTLDLVRAPAENKEAAKQFIDTKLRDYFKTKAGSVSDPLREALISGRIKIPKDTPLEEQFPQALINASRAGDVTAMKEIEKRFDRMMNVSNFRVKQAGAGIDDREAAESFKQTILQQMKANPSVIPDEFLLRLAKKNADKLPPEKAAEEIANIRQKLADNPTLFNTIFEPKITRLIDDQLVENISPSSITQYADLYPALANAPKRQEGIMALQADVPITDLTYMGIPDAFGMQRYEFAQEIMKMDPKDLAQMSVPEFYAKALPSFAKAEAFKEKVSTVDKLAKAGKPVPTEIGYFGTKEFLPTDSSGMTWREITDPQATLIQSKFLGNSIGGYAEAGTYGPLDKGINALKDGETRLFSLYDKNGHAVNNVEFITPKIAYDKLHGYKANTITQMNGNGVKTGNVVPENYAEQMLDLVNALNPTKIPPSISQLFQDRGLMPNPVPPPLAPKENAARQIQMNMFQPPAQRADGGMIERQPTDNRRYL